MDFPKQTALTLLTLAALVTVPDYMPAFKDFHVVTWLDSIRSVLSFQPRIRTTNPVEAEQLRLRPDTFVERAQLTQLYDPKHSLDAFYRALLETENHSPDAGLRILHYGDSPTTADMITADVRALFQKDYGDAGHGFVLLHKPWAWYSHRGVSMNGTGWLVDPANVATIKDGLYGLGAVSFRGWVGAYAEWKLADTAHQSVEIQYLAQPGGGTMVVRADGVPIGTINTQAEQTQPGFRTFPLPSAAKTISVAVTGGQVRLYGARFNKQSPGVEYSSLGVNGAYINVLSRMMDEEHWAANLRHLKPNLVIINYGTNESVYPLFVDKVAEREITTVIERLRRALPNIPILIMAPMDRGEKNQQGEIATVPALSRLVTIQQRTAAANNCAFFNTFEAMGGHGTMGRWYTSEPRLVGADLIHPMPSGAKLVGNLLYRALRQGYFDFKARLAREKFQTDPPVLVADEPKAPESKNKPPAKPPTPAISPKTPLVR